MNRPMAASALLCAALLMGCAEKPPVVEVRYVPQQVPAGLLTCAAKPAVPEVMDDHAVAGYVLDLAEAGEDCRAKLRRVRGVVGE
jgi:hypothetical protein